ncbi:MAG: VCBS repeat-containing protein [Epulopiscium sp.]|nr:VCBS repeat-containing protein [Candidatus Epulonipiscium sp.]
MKKNIMLFIGMISIIIIVIVWRQSKRYKHMEYYIQEQKYDVYFNSKEIIFNNGRQSYSIIPSKNHQYIDMAMGDLHSDGQMNLLILEGKKPPYGEELIIYDWIENANELQIQEKYRNRIDTIHPWKIETCDIDGDGELEIFIAVNKSTYYYPKKENRPFFFNFKDDILVKKWTGSRIRAPFIDVCFTDLNGNGQDDWIVIEESEKGGMVVATYYWFGFGFILQAESEIYEAIDSMRVKQMGENKVIELNIRENGKVHTVLLKPSCYKTKNDIYQLKEGS